MTLPLDPEVAAALMSMPAGEPPAVGDVATRRLNATALFDGIAAARTPATGVDVADHTLTTPDGAHLPMRWYFPAGSSPTGSAALWLHGGGMILSLEHVGRAYDLAARDYVAASGVPMLVVDYRVAPEFPYPVPVEDCYAALEWLVAQSTTLGVDPSRIALLGDSAGGGLAASVALLARDRRGPAPALQLLVYPMLDDQTVTPDPVLPPDALIWTYDDNVTGWNALLGDRAGTSDVSAYAAPARATDLAGLPPTYIDVGDIDIFCQEDITFAQRLIEAGVPTDLHVYPGCPHAFEVIAPQAAVSRRAFTERVRRLQQI